jgi:hypothetical protein
MCSSVANSYKSILKLLFTFLSWSRSVSGEARKSNKKIKAREKWLKFTAFRYSEEAYFVATNFFCNKTYELLQNKTENLRSLKLHSINSLTLFFDAVPKFILLPFSFDFVFETSYQYPDNLSRLREVASFFMRFIQKPIKGNAY